MGDRDEVRFRVGALNVTVRRTPRVVIVLGRSTAHIAADRVLVAHEGGAGRAPSGGEGAPEARPAERVHDAAEEDESDAVAKAADTPVEGEEG